MSERGFTGLISRRALLGAGSALALGHRQGARAQEGGAPMRLPIGWPDRLPGDGFLIRHGYACENTWYNPGSWHTAEDWYAFDQDTAGALVSAIAAGEVVFTGSDYPGRVVIIRHEGDLFSMYGHLDFELAVAQGERVDAGQQLGTVLLQTQVQAQGRAPSHLHFEIRTFLLAPEVNGNAPRYNFPCGFECAPGPGYWPMNAPEHPSAMGWRHPTHVIGRRLDGVAEVEVASHAAASTSLWSAPEDRVGAERLGDLALEPGTRFPLRSAVAGREATERTSAESYRLWFELDLPDRSIGWVRAAVPSDFDTGSDGRPSSVVFNFLPIS